MFRVGSLLRDPEVLRQAQSAAAELIASDEPLPGPLSAAVNALLEHGEFSMN